MSTTKVLAKLSHPYKITLYRNGDNPNIYYYFTFEGRMSRGSTGTDNLDAATDKMSDIFVNIKKGKTPKQQRAESLKLSIAVDKFIAYKQQKLRKSTIDTYILETKYLLEHFKNRTIESITHNDYLKYMKWRQNFYANHPNKKQRTYKTKNKIITGRHNKEVGNASINRECGLLVSILRFSKKCLHAFQGKDVPQYQKLPEQPRDEILSKKEYQILKGYWTRKNPYYWEIISFVNNTGVRYPSELNGIQWKDIDLKNSFMTIRDRKSKGGMLNSCVPLIGTAKQIIEGLKNRVNISKKDDDYVFVNDTGRRIKNIRKAFKLSLSACGISKSISMYSLRHLFATRMMKRPDIPPKSLALVLGHKDTRMIDRVYSHLHQHDIVTIFQRSEKNDQEHFEEADAD